MQRLAPNYDVADLLARSVRAKPPISRNSVTITQHPPTAFAVSPPGKYLSVADQAKKEPSFVPLPNVLNFLKDKGLMQHLAPNYDVADLLVRSVRVKPPNSRNSHYNQAASANGL